MNVFWTLFILLIFQLPVFSQDRGILARQARWFRLEQQTDSIDFIKIGPDLDQRKPVFLLCQGSLPIPLFLDFGERGIAMIGGGVSNFDLPGILKHYHLIVISMPHTPVVVPKSQVDQSYCYLPDPTKPREFFKPYVEADHLDTYVDRAQIVWNWLKGQSWVNPNDLVIAGHSQGSKIAARFALQEKDVTRVGLFAANPFGRMDQFVRQARHDAQKGKISWEEADKNMQDHYDFFQKAADSTEHKAMYKTTMSFSQIFLNDWLQLDIPLYLAYGTEDRTSDLCDLVPLFFIQEKKTNLTFKRYLNLEHNFFEVENERPNYEKAHW
ncbi:MAG: hypothetical protein AAF206_11605, partial [Bacteroidota bacterium]